MSNVIRNIYVYIREVALKLLLAQLPCWDRPLAWGCLDGLDEMRKLRRK